MEHPEWFFMWSTGRPYITMICGWSKKDCINEVRKAHGQTWKEIYARGGRVVRVKIEICKSPKSAKSGF